MTQQTLHRSALTACAAAVLLAAVSGAVGQTAPPIYLPVGQPQPSYVPGPPVLPAIPVPQYTPAQLDQLAAPIALYPDPLLASLLPASTFPNDLTAAAQWLTYTPAPAEPQIDIQPWDPSVKALVHYPNIVTWMAQNLAWTQTLGSAFVNQQGDLVAAIQRLRAEALAAGSLVTTPQQQVVAAADGSIQILPADPAVIFVPIYDPQVVYVRPLYPRHDLITFGAGLQVGRWLDFDFDWHDRHLVVGVGPDRGRPRVEVRPGVRVEPAPPTRVWTRNPDRPAPVPPHVIAPPPVHDEHHGFAPAAPEPPVFGGYGRREDAAQAEQRASDHGQPHAAPAPGPPPRGPEPHGPEFHGGPSASPAPAPSPNAPPSPTPGRPPFGR